MSDASAWVAALPVLGGIWNALRSFFASDVERSAARHAKLLTELPENAKDQPLRDLLAIEIEEIARRGESRLYRKVSGSAIAALIFVLVMATSASWLLWTTPNDRGWPLWVEYGFHVVALGVALFGFLLLAVGSRSVFVDSRADNAE